MAVRTRRGDRGPNRRMYPAIFGSPGTLSGEEICARQGCGHLGVQHGPRGCEACEICPAFVLPLEARMKPTGPIRETSTMTYYAGPLGEIFVPKKTRICTVCGQEAFMNIDEIQRHRKHGGKLVMKPRDEEREIIIQQERDEAMENPEGGEYEGPENFAESDYGDAPGA